MSSCQSIRSRVGSYHHPVGTCAMGTVVDARGAVHGVAGLWVADASVFPEVPRANTNLAAMMIGYRAADVIPALMQREAKPELHGIE